VKRFWHFTVLKDGIEKNKEIIKKKKIGVKMKIALIFHYPLLQ
jgi:hypothetical protein